ncbi:EF-hand domain-containing protein [Pseudoalteromonas sp. Hal273]|uniref:calmodulin n=1 Tax=Pseudoalteromonas distincta TaxID=77608 RepID=UPI0030718ADC
MKTLNTTLAVIVLASSSAAYAAVDFASFDADGDGAISMEEAKVNPQLVKIFDDLDTDGNGEISKEEFSKVQ